MKSDFIHKNFTKYKISCRFTRKLKKKEPLILILPDGPAISSRYLDKTAINLSKKVGLNVGILDYSNHKRSKIPKKYRHLKYSDSFKIIYSAYKKIKKKSSGIILIGHSLGARYAFSLATKDEGADILSLISIDLPYQFSPSLAFNQKYEQIFIDPETMAINTDEKYKTYLKLIIPLYFSGEISQNISDLLIKDARWEGNEKIIETAEPFYDVAHKYQQMKIDIPLLFLEGKFDEVVPDNNLEILKGIFENAVFKFITESGHFPMLENQKDTLEEITSFIKSNIYN